MRSFSLIALRALVCLTLGALFAVAILPTRAIRTVRAQDNPGIHPEIPSLPPGSAYRQTNFASDIPGMAPILDPFMVNPWGISASAGSPFWLSNQGTSTSGLWRGDVSGSPMVRNPSMPLVNLSAAGGLPTGTVFNTGGATEFVLTTPCAAPPCRATFLFASLSGNIIGWNPNTPAA